MEHDCNDNEDGRRGPYAISDDSVGHHGDACVMMLMTMALIYGEYVAADDAVSSSYLF